MDTLSQRLGLTIESGLLLDNKRCGGVGDTLSSPTVIAEWLALIVGVQNAIGVHGDSLNTLDGKP